MQHAKLIILALILLAATSCQKVISLKLNNASPQLVIEGNITNIKGAQYIIISKSVSLNNTDDFPGVEDAQVSVKDSRGRIYIFQQDTAGIYSYSQMVGVPGVTYTLTVVAGGQTYTASSTMPQPVNLDSLTEQVGTLAGSNLYTIVANYQDPANETNQYRFLLTVNNKPVGAIFVSDDSFTNGKYVRNDLIQNSTDIHYGDTVSVEMQCIDKNVYEYWYSLSQQQVEGPGGGTTPSNPVSNISNNALGYFSAHTTQTKSIVVD
jgi:hypothetical protein